MAGTEEKIPEDTETLQSLGDQLKDIAQSNQQDIDAINARIDDKVTCGYRYSLNGKVPQTTVSVKNIINSWRYNGEELEIVEDVFNDHIDYKLAIFPDLIRLNQKILNVGLKFSRFLADRVYTRMEVKKMLANMKRIQHAIRDINEKTLDASSESEKELKEVIAAFQKLSKYDNSVTMTLKWDKYGEIEESSNNDLISFKDLMKIERSDLLKGHSNNVYDMVHYNKNNDDFLASCSSDYTIKLWRLSDKQLVRTLSGHTSTVTSLEIFEINNVQFIASASADNSIKIWNLDTYGIVMSLSEHTGGVNFLKSYSIDNKKYLASASYDQTIKLWSLENDNLVTTLTGHTSSVNVLSIFPENDKPLLISGALDNKIKIWDLSSNTPTVTLKGHSGSIQMLKTYERDGIAYLISGSADKSIKIWNLITNSIIKTIKGHSRTMTGLEIVYQGQKAFLASTDFHGKIMFWDLDNFNLVREHSDTSSKITSIVAFNANDVSYMALGCSMAVELWCE